MSDINNKKQMTEEDIKLKYITPAVTSKWELDQITMETKITDGKINLRGNFYSRQAPKKADYVLYMGPNNPMQSLKQRIINIPLLSVCSRLLHMPLC